MKLYAYQHEALKKELAKPVVFPLGQVPLTPLVFMAPSTRTKPDQTLWITHR